MILKLLFHYLLIIALVIDLIEILTSDVIRLEGGNIALCCGLAGCLGSKGFLTPPVWIKWPERLQDLCHFHTAVLNDVQFGRLTACLKQLLGDTLNCIQLEKCFFVFVNFNRFADVFESFPEILSRNDSNILWISVEHRSSRTYGRRRKYRSSFRSSFRRSFRNSFRSSFRSSFRVICNTVQ